MRKMEILLGRIFRDCCLCGTGDADFGICSFAIESGKWIRIGNRMKNTTLHVSAPEMKKKASETTFDRWIGVYLPDSTYQSGRIGCDAPGTEGINSLEKGIYPLLWGMYCTGCCERG